MLRVALAAGAALTLSLGLPVVAQAAATGDFIYANLNGEQSTLRGPEDGVCYPLDSGTHTVVNHTDRRATVFPEHGCVGTAVTVPSGSAVNGASFVVQSVRFG
ncbi:hypothetical protein [Streptomyces monashensis]|uniref:Uncharacterized protein n=1 Tax=Streptomyces monashensis TaxID=1678012 RepID=A0A1S2PHX7_9ACTN|nr:hypothetical protein [Streptomyces monashensis]OIJ92614.1 hypothetical protein BIV23_38345 [Streptomyces monashensis]